MGWGSAIREWRQTPNTVAAARHSGIALCRAAFDALPEACLIVNATGRVEFANRAAVQRVAAAPPGPFAGVEAWLRAAPVALERVWRAALSDPAGETCGELVLLRDPHQETPSAPAPCEFLVHLAHELKSPLHTIRAYAEMLQEGSVDPETCNEFFDVITGESQRLAKLIDTLVDLSRIDSGTLVPQRMTVRVDAIVAELLRVVDATARSKAIDLVACIADPLPAALADPDLLAVALHNLLSNAIQYTAAGARVNVRAAATPETITVEIADPGIGIHPDDRSHVFQKFFRGRAPEVRKQPGSGLGLALAERIVALHGGSLAVESTPGLGSTFRLSLPVSEPAEPEAFTVREAC